MHPLALIVAMVAALCAILGLKNGLSSPLGLMKGADLSLLGLAAVGALLTLTTSRLRVLSSFLRIFATIFALEYVLFTSMVLLGKLGLWPSVLAEIMPPASLPVTVAVFGILIYAISFVPVIRTITSLADRFFDTAETTTVRFPVIGERSMRLAPFAKLLVALLVIINQAQVGISLRLSFFNRDWFNAIQNKDASAFWSLLLTVFCFWAAIAVVSNLIEYVIESILKIRWRAWFTTHYQDRWLSPGAHYRMALSGDGADNPDQRIAEDTRGFINQTYGFSISLMAQVSTLVSFSIILWSIPIEFTLPGTSVVVPGAAFWVALAYAALGTWLTHLIGRPLIRLDFEQERREADLRFSLARLREYSEQIALQSGERVERKHLTGRFQEIIINYFTIMRRRVRLAAFTSSYYQADVVVPYILIAPFYFAGKIQLGVMTQVAGAFGRVSTALSFFIGSYTAIAAYKAVIDRLTSFDVAIDRADRLQAERDAKLVVKEQGKDITLRDVTLSLPDRREVVHVGALDLRAGESTLLTGPSGSGKSTLFRAIAGIWPYGRGEISLPESRQVLLLPQRPYMPLGTLREAVCYPAEVGAYSDAAIRHALAAVKLGHLVDDLDVFDQWMQRLSGGEQQRLAIARALLMKPAWLFLDEATASLDEPLEAAMIGLLTKSLPETTIVSIGHRSTLQEFHTRRIVMVARDGSQVYEPVDQRAASGKAKA